LSNFKSNPVLFATALRVGSLVNSVEADEKALVQTLYDFSSNLASVVQTAAFKVFTDES